MLCKLFVAFALIGLVRGRAEEPTSPWSEQLDFLKKDCIKNNVDFAGVVAALEKSLDCAITELGYYFHRLKLVPQLFLDETVVPAAKQFCSKKDKIINVCAFDLVDYTVPCWGPEYRDRVNDSKLALQDLTNYICENDAQIIRNMFSEDENKCWKMNAVKYQLRQCMDTFNFVRVEYRSRTEQCIEFHNLKDCTIRALINCPNYTTVVERFFTGIAVGSPCEKRPAALDITTISSVSDSSMVSTIDRAITAMTAHLQKECAKHNVDRAGFDAAFTRAMVCLAAEFDDETRTFILRAKLLPDEENVVGAVRKICTKKEKLGVCVFNLQDFMVSCMDPELRGRVNDSKAALQDFADYICENDAQVIGNLFRKEELSCLESNDISRQLLQCVADVRTSDLDSMSPTERCAESNKLKNCSMGALGRCSTRNYADLMERFFTTIAVGSHCENMSTLSITNELIKK